MPRYEFQCRTCDTTFEVSRPMSESGGPAPCPAGHAETRRMLSIAGVTGVSGGGLPVGVGQPAGGGGGCCGGGCGCG
ncbi:MAG: zinc ribbon domain-containing protein [Actinobacteria bacterium]|nr:zinc ribbon domain-containing protein [Actinomycetota bacterium]